MKRLKFLLVIYFVFSFAIEGKCTNLPKVEKGSISILTKGGVNKSIEIACIESISRSGVNTIIHYESLSSDFKKVLANHSSVNINSVIRNSNWDVLEKINKNGAYLNFNYISEYPKYKNKNCTIKTPRFRYHVSRLTFNKAKEIMDRRTVQSNYLNYNRKYYSILKSYNDKILKDIDLKENMLFKDQLYSELGRENFNYLIKDLPKQQKGYLMSILEKLPKEYKIKFALNISYSSPDDIKKMLNQMQGLQKDQILEITLAYEKLDLNKTQIKRLNNYLGNSNLLKKIKPVNTRKTINRIIKMIL